MRHWQASDCSEPAFIICVYYLRKEGEHMADRTDTMKTKIEISGEKEYRDACKSINAGLREVASEMKLVTAQYADNADSTEALTAKAAVLNKQLVEEQNKVAAAEAALKRMVSEGLEPTDPAYQKMQANLNNNKAAMLDTERAISKNADALNELSEEASGAAQEIEETGDASEKSSGKFEKLGGVLRGIGTALAAVAAAAVAAAIKLGKDVVTQFSELEQNLGGAEAVFGEYADSIAASGEKAYKNLGLSQSEYLATANKMGALFQGSGLTQQRSLELTTQAMQRAADMASVMGINMEDAMNAVAGAAKGNFTMMDNLGVAMNATTIEAYAAGKGLDFVWASASGAEREEMAMRMFFETTEQYAGNFAKESVSTISGSLGLLKASVSSLTAGLGNSGADIALLSANVADAFGAVVDNIAPVLESVAAALPQAVGALTSQLMRLLPTLLETASQLFAEILSALVQMLPALIPAAVQAVITITSALIDNLPQIIAAAMLIVQSLITGIADALPTLIPAAVQAIVTIIQGLIESLPLLLDAALQLISGLAQGLIAALPVLIEALPQIIAAVTTFIISAIPQIVDAGIQLFTALIGALPDIITAIVEVIPQIIDGIVTAIVESVPLLVQAGIDLLTALIGALPDIITAIVEAIPQIIDGIITAIVESVPLLVQAGIDLLIALVQNLPAIINGIVAAIPKIIDSIITAVIDAVPLLIQAGIELFVALIANLPQIIVEIVKAIPQIIIGIVDAIGSLVYMLADAGLNLIKGLWNGIKDAAAWIWDKVKGWCSDLLGKIKGFFGIHSPSTVFADIGDNMAAGMGVGFGREMKNVEQNMKSRLGTTVRAMQRIGASMQLASDTESMKAVNQTARRLRAAVSATSRRYPEFKIAASSLGISGRETELTQLCRTYLPALLAKQQQSKIMLDTGTLVGELAEPMDAALGNLQIKKQRRLC
jgi:phage-related protein